MGVLEMMIEKHQSWQTNAHLRTGLRRDLASTPCQCSADKLQDDGALCCTYVAARYLSAELYRAPHEKGCNSTGILFVCGQYSLGLFQCEFYKLVTSLY